MPISIELGQSVGRNSHLLGIVYILLSCALVYS